MPDRKRIEYLKQVGESGSGSEFPLHDPVPVDISPSLITVALPPIAIR